MGNTSRVVYFDHNATTRPSDEVLEALRHSAEVYENPSSSHAGGKRARALIEAGRGEVAKLVGCCPEDVVFTGSGTEAINTAILGLAWKFLGESCHVITTAIEHAATLESCRRLEKLGMEVTYLPVGADGIVSPDSVREAIKPHTRLIAVMHANNEIGVIQPIEEICRVAHEVEVPLFTDAVQTAGKIPLDFGGLGAHLMAISAHKFHGPKGVGALIRSKEVCIAPLLTGGDQESGLPPVPMSRETASDGIVSAAGRRMDPIPCRSQPQS